MATRLLTYIQEVPGLNLGSDTGYTETSRNISQSL